MLHVMEHTLIDTLKLIPFLFLTYLAMEYLEHRAAARTQELVGKAGRLGPVIGGILGILPQCGFAAGASGLYAGRVISLGTLLAIYLSTSDEMLPILISEQAPAGEILKLLGMKAVIGILAGLLVDLLWGWRKWEGGFWIKPGQREVSSQREVSGQREVPGQKEGTDPEGNPALQRELTEQNRKMQNQEKGHIHSPCEREHCGCEKGIFRSALVHTAQIGIFLLLVTFALNLILHFIGEDALESLVLNNPILGPVLAGLVGLIPNCAGSVVITQLYLRGAMGVGAAMAGLLTGTGVGLLVLFRADHDRKDVLKVLGLLYFIGVFVGIVVK